MDPKDILESIDRELAFYRSRHMSISYLALLAEALVVTGKATIHVTHPTIAAVTYTIFFAGIALFSVLFHRSYAERDDHLTSKRAELIVSSGIAQPFKKPEKFRTPSPSYLTLITIILVAIVAVMLTWFA